MLYASPPTIVFTKQVCLLAMLLVLGAGPARAATVVSVSDQVTPDLAGHRTYTLTATTDEGDFIGFDFAGSGAGSGVGFFGPLNQVNPFALATVFNDNNGAFGGVGADVLQDSQFLVDSTTGIPVNALEDGNRLQAAFNLTGGADFTSTFAFAQIVVSDGEMVEFNGTLTIKTASGNILTPVSGTIGVPEPQAAGLLLWGSLGILFVLARRRCGRLLCAIHP